MAANVETMFYTRERPWHGLGVRVERALCAKEALEMAGLDWKVVQKEIYTKEGLYVPGYKANVRDKDDSILGVVTDRYKVVQNEEAFAFTDALLGEGVRYETAGSLQGGKRTWILAKLPSEYIITGERISPYLVFSNSHDGTAAIRVAMTPIRVVCQNTLNLALDTAKRSWSAIHTGNIRDKLEDARQTLLHAENYMDALGQEIEQLQRQKIAEKKVLEYIDEFFPVTADMTKTQQRNINRMKEDMKLRYFEAPDLTGLSHNAYRFVNAVSDFATHANPIRRTGTYKENLFLKTVEGSPLIDRAYQMVKAA